MKILVAALAMTLLAVSPAFAATFDIDAGFFTETSLEGSGFNITIDPIGGGDGD